jgi:predicted secreted acid phosphatase
MQTASSIAATATARPFRDSVDVAKSTDSMHVALAAAKAAVLRLIARNKLTHATTAFVMDIDDTLVFDENEDEDGRDLSHPCGKDMKELRAGMMELFTFCKRFGAVYLVTAREAAQDVSDFTVAELKAAHVRGWEKLFLCPRRMRGSWSDIAEFKRRARRSITRNAKRHILLTVGDKWSDHLAHVETADADRAHAGKCKFMLLRVVDGHQHTVIALKLPAR